MAKKKNSPLNLEGKLKKCKEEIAANAKDAAWMRKQLALLTSLQKQADVEAVELIVPCKEVKETIDFGACRISRTIRGYLFEAKGGMYTFVEHRMAGVAAMFNTLFELHNKERDEEEEQLYESFKNAVTVIFQSLIFASLDDGMLFGIAADILKRFNEYNEAYIANAEKHEETEEDIKENIEYENAAKAMKRLADDDSSSYK